MPNQLTYSGFQRQKQVKFEQHNFELENHFCFRVCENFLDRTAVFGILLQLPSVNTREFFSGNLARNALRDKFPETLHSVTVPTSR